MDLDDFWHIEGDLDIVSPNMKHLLALQIGFVCPKYNQEVYPGFLVTIRCQDDQEGPECKNKSWGCVG